MIQQFYICKDCGGARSYGSAARCKKCYRANLTKMAERRKARRAHRKAVFARTSRATEDAFHHKSPFIIDDDFVDHHTPLEMLQAKETVVLRLVAERGLSREQAERFVIENL